MLYLVVLVLESSRAEPSQTRKDERTSSALCQGKGDDVPKATGFSFLRLARFPRKRVELCEKGFASSQDSPYSAAPLSCKRLNLRPCHCACASACLHFKLLWACSSFHTHTQTHIPCETDTKLMSWPGRSAFAETKTFCFYCYCVCCCVILSFQRVAAQKRKEMKPKQKQKPKPNLKGRKVNSFRSCQSDEATDRNNSNKNNWLGRENKCCRQNGRV